MEDKDKDKIIFDSEKPLVLKEESPLILKNEIKSDYKKNIVKNDEIIKIKDLVKNKYKSSLNGENSENSKNVNIDFINIRNTANKINEDIKEKRSIIDETIKNQEKELNSLHDEKNLLNKSRLEINQHKKDIQSEIINNQQKLIDNNRIEKKELISNLQKVKNELKNTEEKNRSFEINNHELNSTLSRYIIESKNLHKENEDLKILNKDLETNLSKDLTNKENKELKLNLEKKELLLEERLNNNELLESNNLKLKETIEQYHSDIKKLQDEFNELKNNYFEVTQSNLKLNEINQKIKFFQDENIRLSSELMASEEKNDAIKKNFMTLELEKNQISQQIKSLNELINNSNINILDTDFPGEPFENDENVNVDLKKNSDPESENLNQEINKIFIP